MNRYLRFIFLMFLCALPISASVDRTSAQQTTPSGALSARYPLDYYNQDSDPNEEAKALRDAVAQEFASSLGWQFVSWSSYSEAKYEEYREVPEDDTCKISGSLTITDYVDDDGSVVEDDFRSYIERGDFRGADFHGLTNGLSQEEAVERFAWQEGVFEYNISFGNGCFLSPGYEDYHIGKALGYAETIYEIAHRYGLHTWTPADIYGEMEQPPVEEPPPLAGTPTPESTPQANCMDGSCEEAFCEDDISGVIQHGILDEDMGVCHINSMQISSFDCGQQSSSDEEYYDCDYALHECFYGYALTCPGGCNEETGRCIGGAPLPEGDLCARITCEPAYCEGNTSWYEGECDPADGACKYYTEDCLEGCNPDSGRCNQSSGGVDDDSDELLEFLRILGGIAAGGGGVLGGGYLGYRLLRTLLGRRADVPKMPPKPAPPPEEPSLGDLMSKFDQMEESLDRASEGLDRAHKTVQEHQLRYREHVRRIVKHDEKWAKHMSDRAKLLEHGEWAVNKIKKGADIGADILGNVPGAGPIFKYSYHIGTTAIQSAAGGDSLGQVAYKSGIKTLETYIGDKIGQRIINPLRGLPKDSLHQGVRQVVKKAGLDRVFCEGAKNDFVNELINTHKAIGKKTPLGKIETKIDNFAKSVDRKYISDLAGKVARKIF